ncbi:hypothetical protein ZWY2020_049443 [Hordeum vulgare]|nr:hypothetical protein ZWY2020_049443 [Hordeum vulgare]
MFKLHRHRSSDGPGVGSSGSPASAVMMGELKKLVEDGKIKYVGMSEASGSTIRRAHAVHPITVVQLEWSL